MTTAGNVNGANVNSSGVVTAVGNVNGANVNSSGVVTAVGNVNGSNFNATANITGGNIIATANINGGNVNTNKLSTLSGDLELTSGATNGNVYLLPTGSGNVILSSSYINGVRNPEQAQDAATKQYVDDAVSTGITIHTPVQLLACTLCVGNNYSQGGTTATVTDTVAGNTVVFSSAISPQSNDQYWFTNSFNGIQGNVPYFVVSSPNTSAAVLSASYNGTPVTDITSASGLTQAVRINSGQGATITNDGANVRLVVDSTPVTTGDRVLLSAQTDPAQNGVYDVTEQGAPDSPGPGAQWVLTRSSDMDTYIPNDITGLDVGDYFYVQEGNLNKGESWVMTAPIGPVIIGYDSLTFTQFSSSQVYSANTAAGLVLNGTVFSAKVDNNTTAFDVLGNIIVKTSANLVTPNIGAATGTSLVVTGNVSGGNLITSGVVAATGNVSGGNLTTGGVVDATGTVTGGNLTTTGTLSVTGNANVGNIGAVTAVFSGNVSSLNANLGNLAIANFLQGTLTTAAQPNITSVGTLSSLTVSGNIAGGNISTTGVLSVTGNANVGNIGAVSGVFTGTMSVTGNANVGNLGTSGLITATGNVTGGNITTAGLTNTGTLSVSSTSSFTGNVTSAFNVTGNIAGGNISSPGTITATGNITGGNISTVGTATVATLTVSTLANITATTAATSNVTGALIVAGGAGIGGNLYAGDMYSNGDLVLTDQSTIDGGLY